MPARYANLVINLAVLVSISTVDTKGTATRKSIVITINVVSAATGKANIGQANNN